jgi:hypothetical protein
MSMIDDIKRDREAGTPHLGGWGWYGGRNNVYLATHCGGRQYVMDFARFGFSGAQPRFGRKGEMIGALSSLTQYEVGDGLARGQKSADADPSVYRMDIRGIDHPDARRIARVPDMEAALIAAEELAQELETLHDAEFSGSLRRAIAAYRKATEAQT